MKMRDLFVFTSAAGMLFFGTATHAQEPAGGASSMPAASSQAPETTSTSAKMSGKEKHFSGALVDIGCMAKALGRKDSAPAPSPGSSAPPGSSNFVESGAQAPGGGGQSPGGAPGGPGAGVPSNPSANGASQPSVGGMSPEEQAQAARTQRIDNAAKQCTPSSQTQVFGLEKGDGEVVQFDSASSSKAREAIQGANVEQGKKLKAKVTGTMENDTVMRVASVEVKGKGKHSGAGSGGM